ncbi:hypothetical protein [uncultured Methanobrevibacter sp.]|uniref:hypothetical protein n=1 Tax=uncultured Methanobrevibacter sp. TaxID=253161 RepID=UPI0025E65E69|nr:hypothetical protein [uncultured Methanobrevibacter sp.]
MGSGGWTRSSYASYSTSRGLSYDTTTGRATGQEYTARKLDTDLDPRNFKIRECANSDEHPNTIPVILALDVTGSMGRSCNECAEALNVIMSNLYTKYADIEICVMGIGDLAYDHAPIQMSQFESDIRIAESLNKIYMEHGGGGNSYESYTAAWYMGLNRTKLDAFDKQNRKGIIITMGDEELNPYLPKGKLNYFINGSEQADVETKDLYEQAIKKFNIFHIAVDDKDNCYRQHKNGIQNTFGQLLGSNLKLATVNNLAQIIEECIDEAVGNNSNVTSDEVEPESSSQVKFNEKGEITW